MVDCKKILKVPVARYVDDFFGASAKGIRCTGGVAVSILSDLLGIPCDIDKAVDYGSLMVVLGIQLNIDFSRKMVTMVIQEAKAKAWAELISSVLAASHLDPGAAAKLAGRLSFAVTAAAGRVGRAYVKPLYAQASSPLSGNRLSMWLTFALVWWLAYLKERPVTEVGATVARRHVIAWTDAAGESRWLGAVLYADGLFFFARCITPDGIFEQLIDRGDNQIGVQEMLGVLLLFESFADRLKGALVTLYIDNDGVLGSCIKGSSFGPEINLCVGRMWLTIARLGVDVSFARVESKANVADGPTRDFLDVLLGLGAACVTAKLPGWLRSLWTSIQANDLDLASLVQ